MAVDIEKIKSFFHPAFRGKVEGTLYGIERIIERATHTKERYGRYFFKLIDCDCLSENSALYLTFFYGYDRRLDKPSERHFAVYLEFKDNQIIRESLLSNPPRGSNDFASLEDNFTIELAQKKRLFHILKLSNDQHIPLTSREIDCLYYYLVGKTYREIGELLFISNKTVDAHLNNIKVKCSLVSIKALKTFFKLQ